MAARLMAIELEGMCQIYVMREPYDFDPESRIFMLPEDFIRRYNTLESAWQAMQQELDKIIKEGDR